MCQELKSLSKIVFLIVCTIYTSAKTHAQISTQVGIGAMFVNGDVDPVIDALNSFHIGLSKSISNNFNAELKLGLGKTVGLSGASMQTVQYGGGLIEEEYAILGDNIWYPNYLSTHAYADLSVNYVLNTGIERLRFIGGAGLGVSLYSLNVNLLGLEGTQYDIQLPVSTDLNEVKDAINRGYDNTYETKFDHGGFAPHLSLQFGIQYRITRGIYFSLDVRHHLTNSDYLDPISRILPDQESGNNDSVSIFTIGFVGYLLPDVNEGNGPVKLK